MTFDSPTNIKNAEFYNRTSCCEDRIGGAEMHFKDANGTIIYTFTFPTTGNTDIVNISDPSGFIANVKTVELTNFQGASQNFREIIFYPAAPYLNSVGDSVFSYENGYDSDVFGIGKDNDSSLDQRVSASVNNGSILTIATDDDFTTANTGTGRTSLTDGQFLVI